MATSKATGKDREQQKGQPTMNTPPIVSLEKWEAARQQLLAKEKALTRSRDALAAERRRMPYALSTLPGQPAHLLAALRGGSLLLTRDAGESWSRLPIRLSDAIALAVATA